MVVTRRPPIPPVPASRTNSDQPIPRVKGKVPPATAPDVSSPLANGLTRDDAENLEAAKHPSAPDASDKKGKGKGKGKQKKAKDKSRKKRTTFVELLTRAFLLWFTVYTLSVCPKDDSLDSRVCRGLYHYRKLVLEPYILPPLKQALAHPSVSPYVERVKPYVDHAAAVALPIARRTQVEWDQRVVPQWKKRVVPQWNQHVVPQYKQHIEPYVTRVEQQVEPYVLKLQTEYESKLDPFIRTIAGNLHKFQQNARPYVVLAAHKTYDGYQRAKPYAIPLLQRLQLLLVQLAQFLGEQRRQFVDPHVKKIWERVNELGNGDATPLVHVRSSVTASASQAAASLSSVVSSVFATSTSLVPESSEAVVGSASPVLPDIVSEHETAPAVVPTTNPVATLKEHMPAASSISSVVSSVTEGGEGAASSASATVSSAIETISSSASSVGSVGSSIAVDDVFSSASSVAEEPVVSVAASLEEQETSSVYSLAEEATNTLPQSSAAASTAAPEALSATLSATNEAEGTASLPDSSAASSVPTEAAVDSDDDDPEMADILADLGLDADFLDLEPSEVQTAEPVVVTESEEEKAEKLRLRKEETARKRADITGRHTKWETALDEQIAKNKKELRRALVTIRKTATSELKEHAAIRKEIEDLVEDAEKYLKGAERYMSTLKKESRSSDEKRIIWERVVEKVDKKFADRLAQTEVLVNGWYAEVVERETDEVSRLAAEVRAIVDRAQTDIGLDYAYLDDVTYLDWQRYHDLERRHENLLQEMMSVQNGTHPSPPVNPVLAALRDLENEVQDVTVGFETRLRRIRRSGERVFGGTPDDTDTSEEAEDETVSILPIEDTHGRMEGEPPAAAPVVIGRSSEEIVSALDRAVKQEAHTASAAADESKDSEEVVESLAAADEVISPAHQPRHNEL